MNVRDQEIVEYISYTVTIGYSKEAHEYMQTFVKTYPLLAIPEEFLKGVIEDALVESEARFDLDHNIKITSKVSVTEVTYSEPY